ncbi:hypothetical protein CesoFtcFv8_025863 [Champsocephalus esox]|uniref:Uncharacterized protein n=1 Tax=Champsocephalus esox TaxID=159716 RepID=A0AAN8GAY9_9TELE|nr:hypothetical protein CesoFtcFv8_025863 [Champsocephalus esox]
MAACDLHPVMRRSAQGPEAMLHPDTPAFDLLITWFSLGLSRDRERLQGRGGAIITSAVVLVARSKPLWVG